MADVRELIEAAEALEAPRPDPRLPLWNAIHVALDRMVDLGVNPVYVADLLALVARGYAGALEGDVMGALRSAGWEAPIPRAGASDVAAFEALTQRTAKLYREVIELDPVRLEVFAFQVTSQVSREQLAAALQGVPGRWHQGGRVDEPNLEREARIRAAFERLTDASVTSEEAVARCVAELRDLGALGERPGADPLASLRRQIEELRQAAPGPELLRGVEATSAMLRDALEELRRRAAQPAEEQAQHPTPRHPDEVFEASNRAPGGPMARPEPGAPVIGVDHGTPEAPAVFRGVLADGQIWNLDARPAPDPRLVAAAWRDLQLYGTAVLEVDGRRVRLTRTNEGIVETAEPTPPTIGSAFHTDGVVRDDGWTLDDLRRRAVLPETTVPLAVLGGARLAQAIAGEVRANRSFTGRISEMRWNPGAFERALGIEPFARARPTTEGLAGLFEPQPPPGEQREPRNRAERRRRRRGGL